MKLSVLDGVPSVCSDMNDTKKVRRRGRPLAKDRRWLD
jgi:hypothetical protein